MMNTVFIDGGYSTVIMLTCSQRIFFAVHLAFGLISTFETKPLNTHFVIGEDFQNSTFNCSINDNSGLDTAQYWFEYATKPNGRIIASNDFVTVPSKYVVEGEYNLIILNPETTDAGKYHCQNSRSGSGQIIATAELIVLGKYMLPSLPSSDLM